MTTLHLRSYHQRNCYLHQRNCHQTSSLFRDVCIYRQVGRFQRSSSFATHWCYSRDSQGTTAMTKMTTKIRFLLRIENINAHVVSGLGILVSSKPTRKRRYKVHFTAKHTHTDFSRTLGGSSMTLVDLFDDSLLFSSSSSTPTREDWETGCGDRINDG
jgi:hypothetical protein